MFSDKHQYQQETSGTKKAQALIITLLVLSIISVVVIGIVVLANRDTSQVVNNEKYEKLYNEAEKRIRQIVESSGIATLPGTCSATPPEITADYTQYFCGTAAFPTEDITADVDLKIRDTKLIEDFPLEKDRSFDIGLNGYTGEINFRWSKAMAMEFNLVYTDAGGVVRSIKDVYDLSGVYDSLIGDNPNTDPSGIHDINFQVLDSTDLQRSTRFTISATNGLALGSTISLRVTPRSKTPSDLVNLTASAVDQSSFPFQIREFLASSIDPDDTSSPLANVVSKIPLNPQVDGVFDYSILVDQDLIQ